MTDSPVIERLRVELCALQNQLASGLFTKEGEDAIHQSIEEVMQQIRWREIMEKETAA